MPHNRFQVEARPDGTAGAPRGPAGLIADAAEPLPRLDDPDFGRVFDRFGDARVVLLGAAFDGASEFLRARAAITHWLVERRGFNVVALATDADGCGPAFSAWMWRTREAADFLAGLTSRNAGRAGAGRVRRVPLDLLASDAARSAAVERLQAVDPEAAQVARERFAALSPWASAPTLPGRAGVSGRYAAHEGGVTSLLRDRLQRRMADTPPDAALLDRAGQARLLREAEGFYRSLYYGGGDSGPRRGSHLFETLQAALRAAGPDARAVVWAHNVDVGDARATEMGLTRGDTSLGRLCREAWADEARLIGFGAHNGVIAAAEAWGGPVRPHPLEPAAPDSHERSFHDAHCGPALFDLRSGRNPPLRRALAEARPQRFVGPVYRAADARDSHYAEARLAEQFDAWVWFDRVTAAAPAAEDSV